MAYVAGAQRCWQSLYRDGFAKSWGEPFQRIRKANEYIRIQVFHRTINEYIRIQVFHRTIFDTSNGSLR
jgi:hypothetical protein